MAPPFVLAAGLAIVFTGVLVYGRVLGFYFTDVDTFSLIATSRFDDLAGLLENLSLPMMKGQLPNALFYRPFSSITWGIDERIWGLNPLGYHLTDVLVHLTASLLMFLFVRRMGSEADGWGEEGPEASGRTPRGAFNRRDVDGLLAALIFVVHPIGVESVAAIARRPDLLFGAFSLAALIATQRCLRTGRIRDSGWVALACVMALASKDSAVIVLPLVGLYVLFFARVRNWPDRIAAGFRVCSVPLLAVAAYVAWRAWVLGGLGGYEAKPDLDLLSIVKSSSHVFMCSAVMPGNLDACSPSLSLQLTLVSCVIGLSWVAYIWRVGERSRMRGIGFAGTSVLLFFALYILTGTVALTRTIYALLPYFSVLLAWGVVGAAAGVIAWFREADRRPRALAMHALSGATASALVIALLLGALRGQYLEEWRVIGNRVQTLVREIEATLDDIVPGSVVYTVNLPFKIAPELKRLRDQPVLDDYSLQGWADLAYPRYKLDVVGLTRTRIGLSNPADLPTQIAFDPEEFRLDMSLGLRARVEMFAAKRKWGKEHPVIEVLSAEDFARQHHTIRLEPHAFDRPPIAFWVYVGNDIHLRGFEPWRIDHAGGPAGSAAGGPYRP